MNNKQVKSHLAEFYKILEQLEHTAVKLYEKYPDQEITEEWVKGVSPEEFGRELDDMEAIVIASKIWEMKNDNEGAEDTVVGAANKESSDSN